MLLIRWIGTEIPVFAYLQNTILVACFLGLGIGCFTARQPIDLRRSLIPLTLLLLLMAIPVTRTNLGRISTLLSATGDLVIRGARVGVTPWLSALEVLIGLVVTFALLVLVVDVFVPLGRLLGRLLDEHPHVIRAYSVNIAGSLVGVWLFVLLSFFHQPAAFPGSSSWRAAPGFHRQGEPPPQDEPRTAPGCVLLAGFAGLEPGSLEVEWSPYQKLVLRGQDSARQVGDYVVTVNTVGYQMMTDLSDARTAADPERFAPEMRGLSQYDIPLLLHPDPRSCAIVGAGTGNDVAAALRHGVRAITAVEIDPAIIGIGRVWHPEKPYDSPAVHLINDDARSFFATTREKFDVISFGLLDSHTMTAMTNARLDHYVYTRESIARAKALLAPGGVMVLSFAVQKPYIADRIARVLEDVFGETPLAFQVPTSSYGWGGVMFVSGDLAAARQQIANNPRLANLIANLQKAYPLSLTYTTREATDDWPYIYLDSPGSRFSISCWGP